MTTPATPQDAATSLPPTYDPAEVEKSMQARWNEQKAWHADPASDKPPYGVVIPPPNVTAALHLGHALNNTLQDILIRYHRMAGYNAMWMPGTDHAGIATQTVVDKRLQAEGQPALKDYKKIEAEGGGGREAFIDKVQAWKDEYEATITSQLREMGCSCDWDRQRFTMDETCAAAVREAFFQLFRDGLIYRGKRLVNWDPVTQTALADDEVDMQEIDGQFYYLRYPVCQADGTLTGQFVTVATTRPETMLGDTAVAVNPQDPTHAWAVGAFIRLPIVGRIIPIIGDEYVTIPDPQSSDAKARMSSGFLKVTPAHDPNDYVLGEKHGLTKINVMAPDGRISLSHGWPEEEKPQENTELQPFVGLSREEARKTIVRWFRENDLLADQKPYRHAVGHSYRSHVPVEPYLSDQWYVKVTDNRLAGAALRAMAPDQRQSGTAATWAQAHPFTEKTESEAETGLRFTPARYAKTFQSWHENIRDWCISRQLWWGHRIPVWSLEGEVTDPKLLQKFAAAAEAGDLAVQTQGGQTHVSVRREHDPDTPRWLEAAGFQRDPDVLDTWFSSALWPLSTLGWPQETPELAIWNPTAVLCTAREIITLWVSRMVMFNLYFRKQLPFRDVFIHAMIQDGHGQKMSKSLGNGVDPMDIIHSHGADAMRFTLTSMTTHTQDVRMPVDCVDPFTGETFTPRFITASGGYKVAAPTQERGGKIIVTSYGAASGLARPSSEQRLARNTSEKFDLGQRFANKLWNATRFALSNLTLPDARSLAHGGERDLASRWILTRLHRTIAQAEAALANYNFAEFATCLYDFVWRDLCDWYIEAIKPTVKTNTDQQRVLAACFDAALRLLHPTMPFITERLWEGLNSAAPERELPGLLLPPAAMLMTGDWPQAAAALIDRQAEHEFSLVQDLVGAVRSMRQTHKVPPRTLLKVSCKAAAPIAQTLLEHRRIIAALAVVDPGKIGPEVQRPADAATALVAGAELFVHGLIDAEAEKSRLQKQLAETEKRISGFRGRLANEKYTAKAPKHLVQETRDQLASAEREAEALRAQLTELG